MLDNRTFWRAQMVLLIGLYVAALLLVLQDQASHAVVRVAFIVLVAHVLEIPLAFYMLKARNARPLRVVAATLLFGMIWWLPARRGLMAVA